MTRITLLGIVLMVSLMGMPVEAGFIDANATLSSQPDINGTSYDYTITLTNKSDSTDTIGTFWFAWVPGENFMLNSPLSESSPTGWSAKVTHANRSTDGYAIQWVATSASFYLASGNSLSFDFVSNETPLELANGSPFYPILETTSVVYNAAPFSADSETILTSVPEPSSWILAGLGLIGSVAFRKRKSN